MYKIDIVFLLIDIVPNIIFFILKKKTKKRKTLKYVAYPFTFF